MLERAYIPACLFSRSYRDHTDWYLLIFYCQPMLPNPLPWHQIVYQRWLRRITNDTPVSLLPFVSHLFLAQFSLRSLITGLFGRESRWSIVVGRDTVRCICKLSKTRFFFFHEKLEHSRSKVFQVLRDVA